MTDQETQRLRDTLHKMHSRTIEGAKNQREALDTSIVTLVTPEWLKQCLCKQVKVLAREYRPEYVKPRIANERKSQYTKKSNLFGGKTFAIIESSFADEDEVEGMRKVLYENSALVVDGNHKANYVIF